MNSKTVDKETKDFIENNNVYIEKGDAMNTWIQRKEPGKVTYGIPFSNPHILRVKDNNTILNAGKVLYDCHYTFDEIGRRTTIHSQGKKNKVGLFFGDSTAFGEGCPDNMTLPSIFESLNKNFSCFNYGFPGYGPNHMLLEINSSRFKEQFKDKHGTAFFIYRDDAIKISLGKVPWLEGHPKYTCNEGKVKHQGEYTLSDYKEEGIYLPSEFKEKEYTYTVDLFKEIQKQLNCVSKNINLNIIVVPLSFTAQKIVPMLRDSNINCWNYYHTDIEYLTDCTARFVDGAHTPQANLVLMKKLTEDLINGINRDIILPTTEIKSSELFLKEFKIHTYMLPSMVDFPTDDVGVIISQLFNRYTGEEELKADRLFYLAEKWHQEKLDSLVEKKFYVDDNTLKKLILEEYEYSLKYYTDEY